VLDFGVRRTFAGNVLFETDGRMLLYGVYLHEVTGAQGFFFTLVDTNGVVFKTDYFEDSIGGRALDYPDFQEIGYDRERNSFFIPFVYVETGTWGLFKYSSKNLRLLEGNYPIDEFTDFHQRSWVFEDRVYNLGVTQRLNYRADI